MVPEFDCIPLIGVAKRVTLLVGCCLVDDCRVSADFDVQRSKLQPKSTAPLVSRLPA